VESYKFMRKGFLIFEEAVIHILLCPRYLSFQIPIFLTVHLYTATGTVVGSDSQKCIVYCDIDTQFLRKKSNKAIQFYWPKFLSPMKR
jgi:hypothetical protein